MQAEAVEQHPMDLLESNTLFGLGVTFTIHEETMVNYFLLHYDANAGNVKEQERVLAGAKAYFSYSPAKEKAIVAILTE